MNLALIGALTALVFLLCARKNPTPEARTLTELWAAIRAHGWKAPLRGLIGLVAVLGLIAGCLSVVLLGAAMKAGEGALIVGQATVWHVAGLIGWAPVHVTEAA